jgi:DNA-binding NtrC family response regulator
MYKRMKAVMSNFVTLLVEDDSLQRELMANALAGEGFEVVECTTAEAAEAIVTSTGADLLVLVTDQNLAGAMTGAELAAYARDRHPQLSIIVMSGSTVASLPEDTVFLQKPFLPRKLLEVIRPN